MRKWVLSLAVIAVAAMWLVLPSADASVSFRLQRTSTIYLQPPTYNRLPVGSLVQVVWSADNNFESGGVNPDNITTSKGSTYGNGGTDYLLFSATTPTLGGWTGDLDASAKYYNSDVGGSTIANGYIYVYVFQDGTPQADDWYARFMVTSYGGSAAAFPDADGSPPPTPWTLDVSAGTATRMILGPTSAGGQGYQVVPEPGTIGLFAMGLLPLVFRRLRKK